VVAAKTTRAIKIGDEIDSSAAERRTLRCEMGSCKCRLRALPLEAWCLRRHRAQGDDLEMYDSNQLTFSERPEAFVLGRASHMRLTLCTWSSKL
jgi:hypothetical protein